MKLILCTECRDILKLIYRPRTCSCGRSSGMVRDTTQVGHFTGPARPLELSDVAVKSSLLQKAPANSPGVRLNLYLVDQTQVTHQQDEPWTSKEIAYKQKRQGPKPKKKSKPYIQARHKRRKSS